ncbi:hypothetical protein ACFQV2_32835 [Actinokineospora soli]|uniref:Uncharacterized protein n=1 Tax=Actinokineospora soli TaxID=1048753 RepID=A0ABW2TXM9_9PSEU
MPDGDDTTATPGTETRTVTVSNPPTTDAGGDPSTPTAGARDKVTDYGAAGRAMIDFYLSSTPTATRWGMLTPAAQAAFGSQAAFEEYWAKYKYVASEKALVDGLNADGSANVSATVILTTDTGETSERKTVRVVNMGGKHMIDSDPR